MFPILNSLKLAFYACHFVPLMHFLSVIRFFMDYAFGCDLRSIVEIAPPHNMRSPV